MYGFGGLIIFAVLIVICNKAAGFFNRLAREREYEKRRKEYYQRITAESAQSIAEGLKPPADKVDHVDSLVRANKELLAKRELDQAARDELGIDMRPE